MPHATLSVRLSFYQRAHLSTIPGQSIAAVIQSLAGTSIRSLKLAELGCDSNDLDVGGTLLPATKDFGHLVEHLTALEIEDPRWLAWLPQNSRCFHLQDLTIAVVLSDVPGNNLQGQLTILSILLDECPNLSKLAINTAYCDEVPEHDSITFPKLVSSKPLRQLRVTGEDVIPVDCLFPGIKCQSLIWGVDLWSDSWQELASIMVYQSQWLAYLKQLHIDFSESCMISDSEWQSTYCDMRKILREKSVVFTIDPGYSSSRVHPENLLQCLSTIAGELQKFENIPSRMGHSTCCQSITIQPYLIFPAANY
jgi:hypothetical protein